LLLTGGEATRAAQLIGVAGQRPGVPAVLRQGFAALLAAAQKVPERPSALIREGIALHDKGDYAGALKKYEEALALWPQNSFAHYESGLSRRAQEFVAAGEKPPKPGAVVVNAGRKQSEAVSAAFAKARRHDPFQLHAYQGDDPQVIRGLLALAKTGIPAWDKLVKGQGKQAEDAVLQDLAAACQEAEIHELALAVRQILAARRGRYLPSDHPFIATSLRKLAPGAQTEQILKQLAGGTLKVRQLVVPERPPTEGAKGIDMKQLRLYVPNPELPRRVGNDIMPLVNYIKALQKALAQGLARENLPKAKGLLVAVGIKPGKKARVWCESVEGEIPAEVLRKLEQELAKVETIAVQNGAVGFGMEITLRGQSVGKFPEFPAVWLEAARRSQTRLLVPPDDLFKVIWPD
jgi:tetratricopeptide (TPR) repeat protein